MKYILDASVALKWVLNEPDSGKARQLRDEYRRQTHELIAPDTFVAEISHALTRAERKKIIQVGESIQLVGDIMTTRPDLEPFLPLAPAALDLSSKTRIGFYDCLYLQLAEREKCQVVTADEKLVAALPALAVSLSTF